MAYANHDIDAFRELTVSHNHSLLKCIQCGTCTGSCPSGRRTQLRVRQVIEKAIMGSEDILESDDLWLCTTCYTFFDRCPRDVKPTFIIKGLRNIAVRKGFMKESHQKVAGLFCQTGHLVPINDRVKELRKALDLTELPPTVHSHPESLKEVKKIIESTNFRVGQMLGEYSLFLGCIVPNRYPGIESATKKVFSKIGVKLMDMPGASCCPAPGVVGSFSERTWEAIAARNLTVAEQNRADIVTLCNGCFGTLFEVNSFLRQDAIAEFVGGTPSYGVKMTKQMAKICVARHEFYKIPYLDYIGTPVGIDLRRVLKTGIVPVVNTGLGHKNPGVGQVGAGIAYAPMLCFKKAAKAYGKKYHKKLS